MKDVVVIGNETIVIGYAGENKSTRIIWPKIKADWEEVYGGDGIIRVAIRRPLDKSPYPVVYEISKGDVIWTVTSTDTERYGIGECELAYFVDDVVVKSQTWSIQINRSLTGNKITEPPEDPAKAWFDEIRSQIGDLSKLTTKAKENLVAAINEAAQSGGSGGGGSVSMRVDGGYIQYSTDDGDTWESLIAVADLKGDPGAAGHTPEITASKSGKTTTIKADGTAIAEIQDGADGKDGTDGAPGKDGHTPQKGVDYWTASDKAGIVQDTLAALPTWKGGAY